MDLSDCSRLLLTSMKSSVSQLTSKYVYYRSYKRFDPTQFVNGMKKTGSFLQLLLLTKFISEIMKPLSKLIKKHSSLKKKILKGNHALFITEIENDFFNSYTKSYTKNRDAI